MEPFVKWAGGKRQILDELLSKMPNNFNRYIEPFVGGGALFFKLESEKHNPKRINDTNKQLINCYTQIRDNKKLLIREMDKLQRGHNKSKLIDQNDDTYYYGVRDKFNKRVNVKYEDLTPLDAARFIYLNKTCYNGLYRVNSFGEFNVPSGKKNQINIYSLDNINSCSIALQETDIKVGDFEDACKYLRRGDFVFFDSPYYETFDSYQKDGFSVEDHKRLLKLFKSLHKRGIYCMLTNSDTEFIRDLYKNFNIEEIDVKRFINSDGNNRNGKELIITSYNNYVGNQVD